MKYSLKPTGQFQKDIKRIQRRGYNLELLKTVLKLLAEGIALPKKYKDHQLSGKWHMCRECHITPDWLLIYEIDDSDLILYLMRTGTHSDLF